MPLLQKFTTFPPPHIHFKNTSQTPSNIHHKHPYFRNVPHPYDKIKRFNIPILKSNKSQTPLFQKYIVD